MEDKAFKRAALFSSGLATFLVAFMASSVNIALPSLGRDLKADAISLGWIATSYLLSSAMFSLPLGRLSDIYGRKRTFLFGLLVYSLGSLLSATALSPLQLVLFRFLQGIGAAMIFSTSVAILTSLFPKAERGKAIGINTACIYGGLTTGPFLGGIITHRFGWRTLFLFGVPLCLFAFFLSLTKIKGEWKEAEGERFDILGSLLYSAALFWLIYGLSHASGFKVALGALALLGFLLVESKSKSPALDLSLFLHNANFSLSSLAALLNYAATFAVGFIMSLYLQYVKLLSPQEAGIVMVVQPLTMTLLAPLSGYISDKVEPKVIASVGMAITALSLLLFSRIDQMTGLLYVVTGLILLGVGLAFFSSPNTNALMSSVSKKFFGTASAIVATMRLIGQMLSLALVTYLFSLKMGRVDLSAANLLTFIKVSSLAFKLFMALCILGIFASLGRGTLRR